MIASSTLQDVIYTFQMPAHFRHSDTLDHRTDVQSFLSTSPGGGNAMYKICAYKRNLHAIFWQRQFLSSSRNDSGAA